MNSLFLCLICIIISNHNSKARRGSPGGGPLLSLRAGFSGRCVAGRFAPGGIWFCETCRFGLQYGPFRAMKRAVLEAKTCRFAKR